MILSRNFDGTTGFEDLRTGLEFPTEDLDSSLAEPVLKARGL